jgi:hypothetical protein
MTKVGEGKELPQQPSVEKSRQQLDQNARKFQNALENYNDADSEQKAHLKTVMDQSLAMIRSAMGEIKTTGMGKQEAKVEKSYQTYIKDDSADNLSALQQDLSTLREFNKPS